MDGPHHDPPLTTRDCADYMGRSVDYIQKAIDAGHLQATFVQLPGSRQGRWTIEQAAFVEFLRAIGWHRIPKAG